MINKVCFIGHRYVWDIEARSKLKNAIQKEIDLGCRNFTMGTHGEFDKMVFCECLNFKSEYSDLEVEVVLTSYHKIENKLVGVLKDEYGEIQMIHQDCNVFKDVKTMMFDIETLHYKKQITESNKKMIDGSSTLICYVNTKRFKSGAKTAYNYAKKKGLKIINIY